MPTSKFTTVLSWDAEPTRTAEAGTWGELTIAIGGVPLWGARGGTGRRGVRWTWVDLLEHLAEVWPWLLFEEGWPPGSAFAFPASASDTSVGPHADQAATERPPHEDDPFEHRYRHDLAMAIRGKVLPPLWVVRDGTSAWVGNETIHARLDLEDVEAELRSLGDQIAERLSGVDDERARGAVHAWRSRTGPAAPEHLGDGPDPPAVMLT